MLIISYDFTENRIRSRFSKFLKKFGRKIQYSVYEIKNSERVLRNILDEIELKYKKQFEGSDSILIFQVCEGCRKKIVRYGYAKNEESDLVFFK
ncbi:MAG: CRISPR-associated endonuclease Cas2 [Minisyncoccia bacterium]